MRPTRPLRSPRARLGATLALAALGAALVPATPAQAGSATVAAEPTVLDPTTLSPPSPELADLPKVSLELAQVPVEGVGFDRAASAYAAAHDAHVAERDARIAIDRTRTEARIEIDRLETALVAATARIQGLERRLAQVDDAIRDLAVQSFVEGGSTERLSRALTSEAPAINETDRRAVLGQASMDVLLAERAAYLQRIDDARTRAGDVVAAIDEHAAAGEEARRARPGALGREGERGAAVALERVQYEQARVLATVEGVDFTLVALDAYYRAAASEAEARPSCGIEWWGVAGIAKVEGRHGTYGGATLDHNGDTTRRIIGIQLNGTNNTAVVPDSDGGALDGDAAYDRAVGPMQFIPSTWRAYEADGNGDDVRSPFNMYDATLAATDYLCTASGGLGADPGLRAAYFSYNHSEAYVDSVLGYARAYEDDVEVPERLP